MRILAHVPTLTDAPGGAPVEAPRPDPVPSCWSQPVAASAGPALPARGGAAGVPERGTPRLVRVWACDLTGAGDAWVDELPVAPSRGEDIGAHYAAYLETIVHPEDAARVRGELAAALREQRSFAARYRVRLADGTQRTLQDRGRIVRDADGTPRRLLGVTHDVTDAAWADAAHALPRDGHPGAFPLEADALQGLLVHRGGIALYANRRLALLLGYPCAEHLLARAALHTLAAGVPPDGTVRELAWPRADGSTLWVQAAAQPVVWDGMAACQLAVVDITARKRLEAELAQMRSASATGALAAGLAHDFNNLLQLVTGTATLLGRELPEQGPVRARVEQIRRAAERGSRLVRRLLSLGQPGAVAPAVLDVNDSIAAMVGLMEPTLPSRYRMEYTPRPGLPDAWADAGALEQILLNLLLNARDAMPDGGVLALDAARAELSAAQAGQHPGARPGAFVRITVRDSGVGMTPEVLARMCEPFYSTKPAQRGSGLGLSVVSALVAAQQGFLQAESQAGAGTVVHVFLPLAPAPGTQAAEERPAAADPPRRPAKCLTILVAEPDPMVGGLIVRFLEAAGYKALTAGSGQEALEQAGRLGTGLALVLLSATLQQCSAHEALAKLQAAYPRLPVVITTSGALAPAETFLFQASGRPPLRKPFQLRALLDAVEDSQRDLTLA
jgi:PAS domain S-box-containing protein